MKTVMLPDVGTDLTVEDLESCGGDPQLARGHGIPGDCIFPDEWDGLVKIHQLTPAGYTVTRTIPLSELEAGA